MRHFWLVLILIVAGACTKKTDIDETSQVVQYASLSAHPVMPIVQNQNCKNPVVTKRHTFLIDRFIDGQEAYDLVSYNPTAIGIPLISFNEHIRYIFTASYSEAKGDWNLDDEFSTIEESQALPVVICKDEEYYSSHSVEGAAIATKHVIETGYATVKKVMPSFNVSPIDIKIAPLIQNDIQASRDGQTMIVTKYQTDNAFYNAKDQTMTFLPSSEEAISKHIFAGQFLWKIPMVAAHEYGHHIFGMKVSYGSQTQDIAHQSFCFDNRLVASLKSNKKSSWLRIITNDDVINALSEGFADLFATYILPKSEASLQGVTCLEHNREVKEAYFTNGDKKQFTSGNLVAFFSMLNSEKAQTCRDIDYQDIHVIGAIFAYQTNNLLEHYVSHLLLDRMRRERKLHYILKWVEAFGELAKRREDFGQREFLKRALALMNNIVMKTESNHAELFKLNESLPYSYGTALK